MVCSTSDPLLQTCAMEQSNPFESDEANVFDAQTFDDIHIDAPLPSNIIDGFLTPDLNEASLPADVDTLEPSAAEIALRPPELPTESRPIGIASPSAHQTTTETINEAVNADRDALAETFDTAIGPTSETASPATADPVSSTIEPVISMEMETAPEVQSPMEPESPPAKNARTGKPDSPTASSTLSPTLPPLEEDRVLFSIDSLPAPAAHTSDPKQQEYLIIVPCSDDEDDDDDDFDDDLPTNIKNITADSTETKNVDLQSVSSKPDASPVVQNPLITRSTSPCIRTLLHTPHCFVLVLKNIGRLNSDRLSISSSSSSCSTLSVCSISVRSHLANASLLRRRPSSLVSVHNRPCIYPKCFYRKKFATSSSDKRNRPAPSPSPKPTFPFHSSRTSR